MQFVHAVGEQLPYLRVAGVNILMHMFIWIFGNHYIKQGMLFPNSQTRLM